MRLAVNNLYKSYPSRSSGKDGQSIRAVVDVSFGIEEGEFATDIGPSGCGKSTLYRLQAGLELPDNGFGFGDFESALSSTLSGGMRQRAALLRTWVDPSLGARCSASAPDLSCSAFLRVR